MAILFGVFLMTIFFLDAQDVTTNQTSPILSTGSLQNVTQWGQNGSQQLPAVQTNLSPDKQSPILPQRTVPSVKANNGDVTASAPDRTKVSEMIGGHSALCVFLMQY